jgi:hypothetical protein
MQKTATKSLRAWQGVSWLLAGLIVCAGLLIHSRRDTHHWILAGFLILFGGFILTGAWQGLFSHSVALRSGRRYTRKDAPMTYWLSISSGFIFAFICFFAGAFL